MESTLAYAQLLTACLAMAPQRLVQLALMGIISNPPVELVWHVPMQIVRSAQLRARAVLAKQIMCSIQESVRPAQMDTITPQHQEGVALLARTQTVQSALLQAHALLAIQIMCSMLESAKLAQMDTITLQLPEVAAFLAQIPTAQYVLLLVRALLAKQTTFSYLESARPAQAVLTIPHLQEGAA